VLCLAIEIAAQDFLLSHATRPSTFSGDDVLFKAKHENHFYEASQQPVVSHSPVLLSCIVNKRFKAECHRHVTPIPLEIFDAWFPNAS
jgi:hypothetical protein